MGGYGSAAPLQPPAEAFTCAVASQEIPSVLIRCSTRKIHRLFQTAQSARFAGRLCNVRKGKIPTNEAKNTQSDGAPPLHLQGVVIE